MATPCHTPMQSLIMEIQIHTHSEHERRTAWGRGVSKDSAVVWSSGPLDNVLWLVTLHISLKYDETRPKLK
jgi:hypothetical protein